MAHARAFVHSKSHEARLDAAVEWLERRPRAETLVVAIRLEAAVSLVARAAARAGTSLGWLPMTLADLAEAMAHETLAASGLRRATMAERMAAARIALEVLDDPSRATLAPRGATPQRQRALVDALASEARNTKGTGPWDALRRAHGDALARSGLVDDAALRELATAHGASLEGRDLLLIDPPIAVDAWARVLRAALAHAGESLVVVPSSESDALTALGRSLGVDDAPRLAAGDEDAAQAPRGTTACDASRDEREGALAIARRCADAIESGVAPSRIAIVAAEARTLRPIDRALSRAGIAHQKPASLVTPAPQWRALRLLLACASERVSAARLGDYLQLALLPLRGDANARRARSLALEAVVRDARVVGGLERWRARIGRELRERELDVDAARALGDGSALASAEARLSAAQDAAEFLLPLVERLDALRTLRAPFGEWRRRLDELAARALDDGGARTQSLAAWLDVAQDVVGDLDDVIDLVEDLAYQDGGDAHVAPLGVALGDAGLLDGRSFDLLILVEGVEAAARDPVLERACAAAARSVVVAARRPLPSGLTERAVGARPIAPERAVDVGELDRAILAALSQRTADEAAGGARYVIESSAHAARALRRRARRALASWTRADGLLDLSPAGHAALAAHHPTKRSFSPTALQHFAACPYRFYLAAVLRLTKREHATPLVRVDALSRGTMVHEVLYETLVDARDDGREVTDPAHSESLRAALDSALSSVAARFEEELAPAAPALFADVVREVRTDLHGWAARLAQEAPYAPRHFELSFGLRDRRPQDPASRVEDVTLDCGLRVRGSIDLVERSAGGSVRATDFKTGKVRATPATVIGGGATLQPVLYALVLEKLFPGEAVAGGRLYYCTEAGSFTSVFIPLDERARAAFERLAATLTQALEQGFFPAAPAERACLYCDFREICGPDEPLRVRRKRPEPLAALERLRSLP